MNLEGLAKDEFMFKIPDNPYDLCPCCCGKKWRFVVKDGEFEKHEAVFVNQYMEKKEKHNENR